MTIRARQTAKEENKIRRLNMLGWTLEEIREIVDKAKSTLSEKFGNGDFAKTEQIKVQVELAFKLFSGLKFFKPDFLVKCAS